MDTVLEKPTIASPPLTPQQLVDRVQAYDPKVDGERLVRAYDYAKQKHAPQMRASGDPYFTHPLQVACLLADMRLDTDTIITALLHDTIEDTDATHAEIARLFGDDVANLVTGVTKLTQLEDKPTEYKQAENFRKLVLAMSDDIRVLLVKLADRLHNMQTLHYISKPEKRLRIAKETMEIYAPLAERMGMHSMKDALQDLSFDEMQPEARASIVKRLAFMKQNDPDLIPRIESVLVSQLQQSDIQAVVYGREKKPYSIWRKMQRKDITMDELSDIYAFRILVNSVGECYAALGELHSKYQIVPGRFKDFISIPKGNGYQSLHTTVIGPENRRVEIQIRTAAMHEVAEMGYAAHWVYKQGETPSAKDGNSIHAGRQFRWMQELLDILESAEGPEEFLEQTKIAMFQNQVFCFSPKGDLVALPRGATSVDFAYAVHSEVGNACTGARVNGRIIPLRTPLQNGDQVEIITQKNHRPSPSWEQFVVTAKAKGHVRKFIRSQRHEQYLALGRRLLETCFKENGRPYSEASLETVLEKFHRDDVETLIAAVGQAHIQAKEILVAIYPEVALQQKEERFDKFIARKQQQAATYGRGNQSMGLDGLVPGMAVHFAKCCHPIPGDRIVGIVSTGKGVSIHTIDCENLKNFEDAPERWIDVSWNQGAADKAHVCRLMVVLENEAGNLGSVCTILGQQHANIHNLKIVNRTQDMHELLLDIDVNDTAHINRIMAALRGNRGVGAVTRVKG